VLTGADTKRVRQLAESSRDYLVSHTAGASLGGTWQPSGSW
jgi:hypothetical protein